MQKELFPYHSTCTIRLDSQEDENLKAIHAVPTGTAMMVDIIKCRVLMIRHHKTGKINGVGGKVDGHGQTLSETVQQEVMEEVGLDLSKDSFSAPVRIGSSQSDKPYGYQGHVCDTLFVVCTDRCHEILIPEEERDKISLEGWIDFNEYRSRTSEMFRSNPRFILPVLETIECLSTGTLSHHEIARRVESFHSGDGSVAVIEGLHEKESKPVLMETTVFQ